MPQHKHDNFLADVINPPGRGQRLTYWDGFRLGLGLITAHLLVCVVLGGLAWGVVLALGLSK